MPASAADVVDSTTADFDIDQGYDVSDDGYDFGPVTTWPAPVQGGDDRNNAYKIDPIHRPPQSGLFDAYAFLRHEPDAPMVHSYPPPYVIHADAAGFVSLSDAGMLHEIAGFIDAGLIGEYEAGSVADDVHNWHVIMVDILKKHGVKLDASGDKAIGNAFFAMSNAAGTKSALQSVADAHAVTLREVRRILKREPTKALADNILLHAQNMQKLIPGGGGLFKAIGSAVASVGSTIAHAATDVAKAAAPLVNVVKVIAPFAQTALSFVPGVGTVVNGAIAAGSALAQGKSITQALIDTAAAAIPGGPIAKQAFTTGLAIVKGQNITTAALDAVRNQIPGGLAAKAAFDTAVALAHGQSVQQAALGAAKQVAQSAVSSVVGPAVSSVVGQARSQGMNVIDRLSPFATRALSSVGPQIIGLAASRAIPSLLSAPVKNVAQAILNRPELRALPIAEVARRMNVTEHDARAGVASVVQAVSKAGGSVVPRLAPATDLANRLGGGHSFDRAIAAFASRARPPVFSHNALRQLGARGFIDAGGIGFSDAGALPPTIQQGSTGAAVQQWQQIIGVTADGKFGPNTKAATVTWQRSRGLVADGIVGPKTWTAALGASTPAPAPAPTVVTVMGQPIATPIPLPGLPSLPASAPSPAPVVVATLANQLPVLRVGSTGPAVMKWQEIVRTKVDGQFGPNTQAATIAWQKSRGLVADGIVGPKTWAAAMTPSAPAPTPAPPPMALPMPAIPGMTQVSLPPIPDFQAPPPPVAQPIPTELPPSITTFPIPPFISSTPPPFIPGQVSTVQTPDGPITGVTDRSGREVTVTQPPITSSAPSSGPGAVGVLLILGTLIAVGSSGRKGFL